MARVYGIHKLALRPGVQAADFERFVREELNPGMQILGEQGNWVHVLKGVRGDREGRYIALFEFESEERFNSITPSLGVFSEEFREFAAPVRHLWEKWASFTTDYTDPTFTDYVVIET